MSKQLVKVQKKVDSDINSESESECEIINKNNINTNTDTDTDTNTDSEIVKPEVMKKTAKKTLKKDTEKKQELSQMSNDVVNNYLEAKDYKNLELYIENTCDIKISEKDILNIIQKFDFCVKYNHNIDNNNEKNGAYNIFKIFSCYANIICKLEKNFIFTENIIIELLKRKISDGYYMHKLNMDIKITKSLFEKIIEFLEENDIYHYNFDKLSFKTEEEKNYVVCINAMRGDYNDFVKFCKENSVILTEDVLEYAFTKNIENYIKKNMISDYQKTKIIKTNDLDEKIIKLKTTSKIDEFILNNKYKITEKTIIIACQNNCSIKILVYLLNYKIKFTENGVNEIIKSYRDNKEIVDLLTNINCYYKFTQNNYYIMSYTKYAHKIFVGKLISELIIDDKIIELFLNYVKIKKCISYNDRDDSDDSDRDDSYLYEKKQEKVLIKILDNIRNLAKKNEENKNNILALYCYHGDEKEIIKFVKDFKCKMTEKSLLFLLKKKGNVKKKIMELFIKDKVKPNIEILFQYMETYSSRKEQEFLVDLYKNN